MKLFDEEPKMRGKQDLGGQVFFLFASFNHELKKLQNVPVGRSNQ